MGENHRLGEVCRAAVRRGPAFSYFNKQRDDRKTVKCFRTATNQHTHDIVREYVHTLAPTTTDGVGPRYCPSLHKKVERFAERDSHVVWLEPEGLGTDLVYPNGLRERGRATCRRRLFEVL